MQCLCESFILFSLVVLIPQLACRITEASAFPPRGSNADPTTKEGKRSKRQAHYGNCSSSGRMLHVELSCILVPLVTLLTPLDASSNLMTPSHRKTPAGPCVCTK